ncbi:MAG: NAD(P)/FAD-dependent oxidoreductase, partial [Saprospiraceae bacterium]
MKSKSKEAIVIIGGGPAAMMLACTLDPILFDVTIVEKGKAIGRKFLVAGKGGFNLTHSEDIDKMIEKYEGPKSLLDSLSSFTNDDLRHWLSLIGIETYVGSSKRVFPVKGIKPIAVLRAIKKEIERKGITLLKETLWSGSFIENSSIQL